MGTSGSGGREKSCKRGGKLNSRHDKNDLLVKLRWTHPAGGWKYCLGPAGVLAQEMQI